MVDIGVDYQDLITCLRTKQDLNQVCLQDATIIFSPRGEKQVDVWQLPPLSTTLLRLCDGTRTVREIAEQLSSSELEVSEIPAEKVCVFGVLQLLEDEFIGLSSVPLTWVKEPEEERYRGPRYSPPPQASNTQQPWPAGSPAEN